VLAVSSADRALGGGSGGAQGKGRQSEAACEEFQEGPRAKHERPWRRGPIDSRSAIGKEAGGARDENAVGSVAGCDGVVT